MLGVLLLLVMVAVVVLIVVVVVMVVVVVLVMVVVVAAAAVPVPKLPLLTNTALHCNPRCKNCTCKLISTTASMVRNRRLTNYFGMPGCWAPSQRSTLSQFPLAVFLQGPCAGLDPATSPVIPTGSSYGYS